MSIITTDQELRAYIPNVFATVDSEETLYDKIKPFLEVSEEWAKNTFTGDAIFNDIAAPDITSPEAIAIKMFLKNIIIYDAMIKAIPSLDVVLTPNGFGIVSNQNIAPASKERVERLMTSLETNRDTAIDTLLRKLPSCNGWSTTEQGLFFAATLFPNLSLCRRLAIKQHLWTEYLSLRSRLIKIENTLADTYFSQEQMTTFRERCLFSLTSCHPLILHVIKSLQSLELMLVSDMQVHNQSFFDLVNIIRQHEETFPQWHASPTAELYIPTIFNNKKSSSAYWF